MKQLTFYALGMLMMALTLASCSNDESHVTMDHEALLKTIANDPAYVKRYQNFQTQKANVAFHKYDMVAIGEVLEMNRGRVNSICEIPTSDFTAVKGGELYQSIQCESFNLLQEYLNRYPEMRTFSENDLDRIDVICKSIHGVIQLDLATIISERAKNNIEE